MSDKQPATVRIDLGGGIAVAIPRTIWERIRNAYGLAPGDIGGVAVTIPEAIWREARRARGLEP